MTYNPIEQFGKRFINDILIYTTGTNLKNSQYFDFKADDNGPFTIYTLETEKAFIQFSVGEDGIEVLYKDIKDDN